MSLHRLVNQQRAQLLFGRISICIIVLQQVHVFVSLANSLQLQNAAVFLTSRAIVALLTAYRGYTAMLLSHRCTIDIILIVGALVYPTISTLGRPIEPILTCAGSCDKPDPSLTGPQLSSCHEARACLLRLCCVRLHALAAIKATKRQP